MTVIRAKGVKRYSSKGKVYYYHRASGERLTATPGTPEFFAEIDRLNGKRAPDPKAGSLGALITAYRGSPEFLGLAASTRADYQAVFDYLQPIDGTAIVTIDSALVLGIRDKAYAKHKRRFANYVVQVVRLLFSWGKPRKWAETNPAEGVPLIKRPKGLAPANRPWSDAELAIVLEDFRQAPALLPGLALGMFAGVTEADAVSLPWSVYTGATIIFQRGKTGVQVEIPAHRDLKAILDQVPRRSPVIMVNQDGQPYSVSGFRGMFFKRIRALEQAGKVQQGLTFHGLRHTVGTKIADAGGSNREIMAILGHATEAMAHHYSKHADRRRQGKSAVVKLERKRK